MSGYAVVKYVPLLYEIYNKSIVLSPIKMTHTTEYDPWNHNTIKHKPWFGSQPLKC